MDKQKIKSVPRLTTDNPVNNFQTALNFTDVSEDGWVWLRQPEMALTEYARQLVKGHGSSIDLGCNDMELSESLTDHLFDDPKQSIDGLIAEHYTILWAYATLREKLKWYEDAGIPVIPNYGLSTIRRAINRYGTAPQLQMAMCDTKSRNVLRVNATLSIWSNPTVTCTGQKPALGSSQDNMENLPA